MWKARGTAATSPSREGSEPRLAGLFQTDPSLEGEVAIAVLEQPSSSCVWWKALGRRIIVLSQSDELNRLQRIEARITDATGNAMTVV